MLVPNIDKATFKEVEYGIKKSRFIARLYPVANKEQAKQVITDARAAYPDARHHCWAYMIASGSSAAMSDDGEPSGTAGKPILSVLQHKNISETIIIVSRYFGGIKLGAGGLVRSYGKAAQMVVDAVTFIEPIPMAQYNLEFDFSSEQLVRHLLQKVGGEILDLDYSNQVVCTISIPEHVSAEFIEKLQAHSIRASQSGSG